MHYVLIMAEEHKDNPALRGEDRDDVVLWWVKKTTTKLYSIYSTMPSRLY